MRHNLLTLSSCHPSDADPPECEHGAVVVNVQEGDLVEFFPQDEKHCVQVLDAFGDEIPPQSSCHLSETEGDVLLLLAQPSAIVVIYHDLRVT